MDAISQTRALISRRGFIVMPFGLAAACSRREGLTRQEYFVTRQKGTDVPFSGTYYKLHAAGSYRCKICDTLLFESSAKYDSATGWPSFTAPANPGAVATQPDNDGGLHRTGLVCARCAAHLGHLFHDGPEPAGLRYCVNESALRFRPAA